MKITIKNIKGETFQLDVHQSETILEVKNKIRNLKSIDSDTQKLILKGQIVVDDKRLEDYGVKEGDLMVLMIAKKAAGIPEPKKEEKQPSSEPKKDQPKPPVSNPNPNSEVNALVMGENYNKAVNDICNMGFPREDVVKAMQAAFNNPDRAIEYLINGLPNENLIPPVQENVGGSNQPNPGNPASQQGGLGNNASLNQLRQAIQSDPNVLQNIMSSLATTNPQLFQAINENPEEFLRALQEEGGEGEDFDEEEGVEIPLTEQDQQAIDRLCALGFDKQAVIEAYLSCEKNEEMAANFLFENGFGGN